MKLRLESNSVRLRLKKSDLQMLREKNSIDETVFFPGSYFTYKLSISNEEKEVTTRMDSQFIEIIIPSGEAMLWMDNNETGIYHTVTFDNHSLNIIIEKDFPCKDKNAEENKDTFIELSQKNHINQC